MTRNRTGMLASILMALLLLAPTASAQTPPLTPGTITVLGEGTASAPAEEASVVITIGADSNIYYEDPMTMQDSPSQPTATTAVNVDNVVDAIVNFGISVNDVTLIEAPFMGEWGSGMGEEPATILVTVMQPTVEQLSELLEVVRSAAHDDGLFVNQYGVLYSVADCRSLRQEARAEAFDNARAEAEDQAAVMNTTLGDAVASRDTYPINVSYFQTNSCNTSTTAAPQSMMYTVAQFDPSMPAEVTVWVAIDVSFDIP